MHNTYALLHYALHYIYVLRFLLIKYYIKKVKIPKVKVRVKFLCFQLISFTLFHI